MAGPLSHHRWRVLAIRLGVSRSVAVDTALLSGIFVALNFLLAPEHLGFSQVNPTPYLLIPLIIGSRHGFQGGFYSGVAVSVLLRIGLYLNEMPFAFDDPGMLYGVCAPPLFGAVCGEMLTFYRRMHLRERHEGKDLRRTIALMRSEIRMLRHDADENIRSGLTAQSQRVNLEDDLRSLMQTAESDLPEALMSVLRNHAQVREAALYEVHDKTTVITRARLLGSNRSLPDKLDTLEHPMLRQAIEVGRITSLAMHATVDVIVDRPHLIAAPLRGDDDKTRLLLVIADVPLIAFSARTVRLVALICKWTEECFEACRGGERVFRIIPGGLNRRIYSLKPFRAFVDACLRLGLRQNVEWRLCEIVAPGDSPLLKRRLEDVVMPALGPDDIAYADEGAAARMIILLPWSNVNATLRFERRMQTRINSEMRGEGVELRMFWAPSVREIDRLFAPPGGGVR